MPGWCSTPEQTFFQQETLYSTPQGLEFDDVLIKPIPSDIKSREEVDISVTLTDKCKLDFPLIASPMRNIVDANFSVMLAEMGGLGILHRFYNTEAEWDNEVSIISKAQRYGLSVGLSESPKRTYSMLDMNPTIFLVDVANGYTSTLLYVCDKLSKYINQNNLDTLLMAGNVATYEGAMALYNNGVDMIRIGIGGGGLCSTRNVTGIGVPQITALLETENIDVFIVSDGGIKNSGDFVKSIVAGSDLCMAGSLFAQTFESPNDNKVYGMASRELMEFKHTQIKSVEGFSKDIEKTMSLKQFVDEFSWGIKSAGTYLNAKNLDEMRSHGEFILAGKNSIKDLN